MCFALDRPLRCSATSGGWRGAAGRRRGRAGGCVRALRDRGCRHSRAGRAHPAAGRRRALPVCPQPDVPGGGGDHRRAGAGTRPARPAGVRRGRGRCHGRVRPRLRGAGPGRPVWRPTQQGHERQLETVSGGRHSRSPGRRVAGALDRGGDQRLAPRRGDSGGHGLRRGRLRAAAVGYVPGEVAHHDRWGRPRSYCRYAELLHAAANSPMWPKLTGSPG